MPIGWCEMLPGPTRRRDGATDTGTRSLRVPAADLYRRLAHRATDGADVTGVLVEMLDQELAQGAIFGLHGSSAGRRCGSTWFGKRRFGQASNRASTQALGRYLAIPSI
jgi:hypothetical protein